MLKGCIAIASGKGGVLKTTLATHFAGLMARDGRRVLLVDCDPQGNAMFDLGYESDDGAGLAAAVCGARPVVLHNVRPNLDVIPGGSALEAVGRCREWDEVQARYRLSEALGPISGCYDTIVLDSPPGELWMRHQILTAAQFVVVPTGIDSASAAGLGSLARTVMDVRAATNPHLDVVAVVPGPFPVTHRVAIEHARALVGSIVDDPELVSRSVIRSAPTIAQRCRELRISAVEYAERAGAAGAPPADRSRLVAARHLAADWIALMCEIDARIAAIAT